MTEIATHEATGLAVTNDQAGWNPYQLAALRTLGVQDATNADLAVFQHVCQRTGLDPFSRQIYMIKRDGKQVIQTGIDGLRLVARRAADRGGEKLRIGEPEWCDAEGRWMDVWLSDDRPPTAARVTVWRGGEPFPATAHYREYVQTARDKQGQEYVTKMWRTRAAGQLAKCAEALALRKAYPQDLAGVYSSDEVSAHQVVQGEVQHQARSVAQIARDRTQTPQPGYSSAPAGDQTGPGVGTPGDEQPAPEAAPGGGGGHGAPPPPPAGERYGGRTGDLPPAPAEDEPITPKQRGLILAGFDRLGVIDRTTRLALTGRAAGLISPASTNDLTRGEASLVIDALGQAETADDLQRLLDERQDQ